MITIHPDASVDAEIVFGLGGLRWEKKKKPDRGDREWRRQIH